MMIGIKKKIDIQIDEHFHTKNLTQFLKTLKIAKDIDSEYFKNYLIAKKAGVIFLAYKYPLIRLSSS